MAPFLFDPQLLFLLELILSLEPADLVAVVGSYVGVLLLQLLDHLGGELALELGIFERQRPRQEVVVVLSAELKALS